MPQSDSKTETIDGANYEVFMLSPTKARDILVDMAKVLGPALAQLADGEGGLAAALEQTVGGGTKFGPIVASLVERIDGQVLDRHMSALAKVTHVDGKELAPIFEIHFRGKIGTMFQWYAFALRTNFGNFTDALASVSSRLPVKVAKA